jgi:hypothetical protein
MEYSPQKTEKMGQGRFPMLKRGLGSVVRCRLPAGDPPEQALSGRHQEATEPGEKQRPCRRFGKGSALVLILTFAMLAPVRSGRHKGCIVTTRKKTCATQTGQS